jgi:hypothetical protein
LAGVGLLMPGQLAPVLAAAIGQWAAVGLPAADVARLRGVTPRITVLPDGYLGASAPRRQHDCPVCPTIVLHELGHTLALNDVNPTQAPTDLMAETLPVAIRRLPSSGGEVAEGAPFAATPASAAALVRLLSAAPSQRTRPPAPAAGFAVPALLPPDLSNIIVALAFPVSAAPAPGAGNQLPLPRVMTVSQTGPAPSAVPLAAGFKDHPPLLDAGLRVVAEEHRT